MRKKQPKKRRQQPRPKKKKKMSKSQLSDRDLASQYKQYGQLMMEMLKDKDAIKRRIAEE